MSCEKCHLGVSQLIFSNFLKLNMDKLLVKRENDNSSQENVALVHLCIAVTRELNLDMQSSNKSAVEIKEFDWMKLISHFLV